MKNTTTQLSDWFVYMIQTESGSLYTGITTDVARRWLEHCAMNDGGSNGNVAKTAKGAKFFRGNKPMQLVYVEPCDGRSEASKREAAIKKLARPAKLALLNDSVNQLSKALASKCQQV